MFGHQNKLRVSAFIKVIPGLVSHNSFLTCSWLSGGTSNRTAPQNASFLNTYCSSSFLLKNGNTSAVHVLGHPVKIQCLTLAISGSLQVPSFICWASTGPLSVVSVKFTMSSLMGVFFGGLVHGTLLRPFAWPFSLPDLCLRVYSVVICLKHYGPLFQGGICSHQTKPIGAGGHC